MTYDEETVREQPIADDEAARKQRSLALGLADIEEQGHVPDRDEIRRLLAKYFVGPITDELVEMVGKDLDDAMANRGTRMGLVSHYEVFTRWMGKAWKEELPYYRSFPTPTDMAMMIANMCADHDESLPQPRMFCPEIFVGTWQQLEPEPPTQARYLWHLFADGSFQSDSPDAPPETKLWGVARDHGVTYSRSRGELVPDEYTLILRRDYDHSGWELTFIHEFDDEMAGAHLGYLEKTPFRLRRVSK